MICEKCLWEAAIRKRVREGKRKRLPSSMDLAVKGHAACKGCMCQHMQYTEGMYRSE